MQAGVTVTGQLNHGLKDSPSLCCSPCFILYYFYSLSLMLSLSLSFAFTLSLLLSLSLLISSVKIYIYQLFIQYNLIKKWLYQKTKV